MPAFPTKIHHYYEAAKGPLRTMSELSSGDFRALMEELSVIATPENRFDQDWKRDFYQSFRPYVEQRIRDRFQEKGGDPKDQFPRYFTLGAVSWFLDWYQDPRELTLDLSAIPENVISFTYPDSMMSYLIAEDRFEPFAQFRMPYHGEVFTLTEIQGIVREYGMPDEEDPQNIEHGNRIIEAQVWDVTLLRSLQSNNEPSTT